MQFGIITCKFFKNGTFQKFTGAYLFQIALKIMLLPKQIQFLGFIFSVFEILC